MKNKLLFMSMFLLIVVGLYAPRSYSQDNPSFTITLANDQQTDSKHYQFDVYLLRTGTNTLELSGLQLSLSYTNTTKNGGTMTAAWDFSSSGLLAANLPFAAIGNATAGILKAGAKGSFPG